MSSSGVPSRQSRPTTLACRPRRRPAAPRSWRSGWAGPASAAQTCRAARRSAAAPAGRCRGATGPSSRAPRCGCSVSTSFSAGAQRGSSSIVQTASDSRGVLRAVLALLPGRADAADVIERGVEALGQVDRDLAVPDAECVLVHDCSRLVGVMPRDCNVSRTAATAPSLGVRCAGHIVQAAPAASICCPLGPCLFRLNV